ncbi:uncharacterized protein RSE6_15108 [Rhynchosporium secalis]|uniref:Uncharacterized protein n=1 Tax=Rhynchosporium secalis TaxID=38038 RepID=A0A1E1MWQ0_RHYSE|nr:uncharacterized protein RSE6_15108 [Rhynchosporium secalis]
MPRAQPCASSTSNPPNIATSTNLYDLCEAPSYDSSSIYTYKKRTRRPNTREPSILDRLGFPEYKKTSGSALAEDTIRDTIKSNTIKEETGSGLIKLSPLSTPIRFVTPASSLLIIRFTNFATTKYTIITRKYEINYNYTTLDEFLAISDHEFRNIATKQNLNKKATTTTILVKVLGILKRETHFGAKRAAKSSS